MPKLSQNFDFFVVDSFNGLLDPGVTAFGPVLTLGNYGQGVSFAFTFPEMLISGTVTINVQGSDDNMTFTTLSSDQVVNNLGTGASVVFSPLNFNTQGRICPQISIKNTPLYVRVEYVPQGGIATVSGPGCPLTTALILQPNLKPTTFQPYDVVVA